MWNTHTNLILSACTRRFLHPHAWMANENFNEPNEHKDSCCMENWEGRDIPVRHFQGNQFKDFRAIAVLAKKKEMLIWWIKFTLNLPVNPIRCHTFTWSMAGLHVNT